MPDPVGIALLLNPKVGFEGAKLSEICHFGGNPPIAIRH